MGDRLERGLARLRWSLAERIRETVGPDTGGVAAALLTGDRSGVEQDDAEALRVSGLGHILAISGLHMALFAGGIYFFARLVLAAIDPFARAHDPRKAAAVIALIAATGYLILSGAAIPTQRAWVMAAVVLIGVMLDRRAFSMRSLAIAALVVIVLAPESVVEAGFQMSFSAVAALIAVYEIWNRIKPKA
jgi:competence protein ComEC